MNILLKWLIMTAAILISSYLLPGAEIAGFWAAFWLALLLGLLNAIIKPLLILITLPINILTLGLFTFVINAIIILLASSAIKGFNINGFWWAMLFSLVLSAVNYLLSSLFIDNKNNRI